MIFTVQQHSDVNYAESSQNFIRTIPYFTTYLKDMSNAPSATLNIHTRYKLYDLILVSVVISVLNELTRRFDGDAGSYTESVAYTKSSEGSSSTMFPRLVIPNPPRADEMVGNADKPKRQAASRRISGRDDASRLSICD